ncbi:hypothetical protein C8R44DRAFT_229014 [Mycena epipterygia]|nr:hypothetical protein C8R44DRAFT_229014 [Mycena epipterygia]
MNLLATCRVFCVCELQLHKSLWLNTLARAPSKIPMNPLPFSKGEELGTLSLEHLRDTARRVNRLLHSFQSDSPRPLRTRNLSVEPSANVFCIRGANLAVAHTASGVSCWDLIPRRVEIQLKALSVISSTLHGAQGKGSHREMNPGGIYKPRRDLHHVQISISHVVSPDMNIPGVLDASFFITSRVLEFYTVFLGSLVHAGKGRSSR